MELSLSLEDVVSIVEPNEVRGVTDDLIRGISSLETAVRGDLSFLGNPKYKPQVAATAASVVLLPLDFVGEPVPNQTFLLVANPSLGLAQLCLRIEKLLWPKPLPGVHPSAVIAPDARISPTATIGPLCVIESGAIIGDHSFLQAQVFLGRNARIGDDCWLMPGVVVETGCEVKNRVRLHPGVVLGSDGFGYEFIGGHHEKIPQVGTVVIEDDVELGANTTIDRARFSRTVIGQGTKIDNLVQIGHNVVVGRHCLICAQVGISGSSTLQDFVVIGGQAGIAGHLTVGKGSKIDGQSGINSDLEPGSFVKGSPYLSYNLEQRINVLRKRLPELFKRVDAIEEKLEKSSAFS